MGFEIRGVERARLREWVTAVESASAEQPTDEAWPYTEALLESERVLGAYDGRQIVGGGASFGFELTVPGGQVKAAGVTNVGVMPSHRRQGILRALMGVQLADVRERGESVAALWASEGSIYGRFGYGVGALSGRIDIERDRATFAEPHSPRGTFRLVTAGEALDLFPPVYERLRVTNPGFFSRSRAWWEMDVLPDLVSFRRGAGPKFQFVHERDGEVVGYVLYRAVHEWGDVGSLSILQVQELIAVDPDALRELWQFVFGVDLMHRIRARVGPIDHPLLLMVSEPRRLGMRIVDGLWLRVVDVVAALEARTYEGSGQLVLEVHDSFMAELGGRWQLTIDDGRARVTPTSASADLILDTRDLSALYLGAFTVAQLARAGRTVEQFAGARAKADALFATTLRPWCPQVF